MKALKLSLTILLFILLQLSLQANNNVALFANNDSKQIDFAVGEIQNALTGKGQESVVMPVSTIKQLKEYEYNIVLLNISDKAGSQLLKGKKISNIEKLKIEGFIIHKESGKAKQSGYLEKMMPA
jgi:hypothetical protein